MLSQYIVAEHCINVLILIFILSCFIYRRRMIVTSTVSPSLKTGLRFLGAWPDEPYANVYPLIYITSILILQYFQYTYIITHLKLSELPNLVDGLPATVVYTLTFLKITILWIHRRTVHEMLAIMDSDWRKYSNVDQHLYLMTIKARISHLCSNVMVHFNIISCIFYLLGDYAIDILHETNDYNATLRHLPIKIQFPFDTEYSPIYELFVAILFLHLMLNSYTVAILNALIFTLVFHACGQIDIICHEFRTIFEKVPVNSISTRALKMLIEKHNKIILFSDHIDKLFSFIALMQVFWDTIVICCLGILVITSVHSITSIIPLVKSVFAYVAIMIEIFVFCFAGEYLSSKSKLIAHAAYDSSWYDVSLHKGKIMLFIIMRSQRKLAISAGGVIDLSLEAFASIMKASASYISVLYAMY